MIESLKFKNKNGLYGIFQKNEDVINYCLGSEKGYGNWSDWTRQVESGYERGDINKPTKESIKFFLKKHAESVDINITEILSESAPGTYFPRINKKNIGFNYVNDSFHLDVRSYRNIQSRLDSLFDYIEPNSMNFQSYGHKIRELLIIACTEVEYLLLKALIENGYEHKKTYCTSDYINCLDIYKLDKWEVQLSSHPNVKLFCPFKGWNKDNPTTSLPWYDAYNAVKHNRGDNIISANFENVLDAVAAIHILLQCQYGHLIFERFYQRIEERSIFVTTEMPIWSLNEISVPILNGFDCKAIWNASKKYFEIHPLPPKPKRRKK